MVQHADAVMICYIYLSNNRARENLPVQPFEPFESQW